MNIIYKSFTISIILMLIFINAKADEVYFDLSEDNIEIKTDFDGKEIIIFGLLQDYHDTILTIKGPSSKMKMQKKERYFGVWINNKQITYSKIPTLIKFLIIKHLIKILFLKMINQLGMKIL